LGIFWIAALVAPAIGPILGGWLVDQHIWRVIFFINPPVGLIGLILGLYCLRERKSEARPGFDLAGVIAEVIGFGAILYAASVAAVQGWTSPATLFFFGLGLVGLLAFGLVELYISKSPLLDLRLFGNRVFLNASLLGYVSTVALFGAEFLMPVYLQSLRGRTALQTGFILLPMAIAGGALVTVSGRLYDKMGPRPLLVTGFALLMINTWQLSQIQADTSIAWIVFLLILRGLALGLTVQTTMVTALSVVPRRDLARGSSLTSATRLVVQSIGVAVLATILASTLSTEVRALQNQYQGKEAANDPTIGLCEAAPVSVQAAGPKDSSYSRLATVALPAAPQQSAIDVGPGGALVQQACAENIAGFERAYLMTFYAALAALVLGLMLPGWPGKWLGRKDMPEVPASLQ
jgi:DHA2 family multidrug resistance protein